LRQQVACQFSGGLFAEGSKPELALTVDGVTLAVPRPDEIIVYRFRKNPDLPGDRSNCASAPKT